MISPVLYTPVNRHYTPVNGHISFGSRRTIPTYDSFTQLKDKSTLLNDLHAEMKKKKELTIGMVDIDNFKSVNELLGYKAGDEFIKAVSRDILSVADKYNAEAYRFGGDEFAILMLSGFSEQEKINIMKQITEKVSKNPILKGKSELYEANANSLLSSYEKQNNKFKKLLENDTKLNILKDIYSKSTIARRDPYVISSLQSANKERSQTYHTLIEESTKGEKDELTRESIKFASLDDGEQKVYEYLAAKYDKNHEIYRLKSWIKEFQKNGFSVTSGVVTFQPSFYTGKQPIDLINEVGEILKKGKSQNKNTVSYGELK